MKRYLARLLSLVLVLCIGLMGCAAPSSVGLTGNYRQDTLMVISNLRTAIALPQDAPGKADVQAQARQFINEFMARYRRDGSVAKTMSFTTMRTALNSLAAHYTAYPNRPVPDKMKNRLEQEFKQIEVSVERGT